jgi:hypothetical protein
MDERDSWVLVDRRRNVRVTEVSLEATTECEDGSVVGAPGEATIAAFDHCALAAKLARLMPLFPEPIPLPEPYKVLEFRQVQVPPSRPIAIDTGRPLLEGPLLEAS